MNNYLVVTGGAGFIGSNLIELLLKKTNYRIISLDNYSTGLKSNHIFSKRVKYIKCDKNVYAYFLDNSLFKIAIKIHANCWEVGGQAREG